MIRIELVGRRFGQLIQRGAVMLVGGVAVVATVLIVNRTLTSEPTTTVGQVPPAEDSANMADPVPVERPASVRARGASLRATEDAPTRPRVSADVAREQTASSRGVTRDQTPRRRRIAVSRDRRETGSRKRSLRGRGGIAPGSENPLWSQACRQTLMLFERMPRAIRFKSLTGNVDGEYAIEGLTSSSRGALTQVQDTLRVYTQLDSGPALWEGMAESGVRFTFRGRFTELDQQPLTALTIKQAEEVFRQVPAWARSSGLREVKVKDPIAKPLADAYARHRQKVWGRGSHRQISAFVESFQQVGQQATLGEIVVIPVYEDSDFWSNALLYAAVDILVHE